MRPSFKQALFLGFLSAAAAQCSSGSDYFREFSGTLNSPSSGLVELFGIGTGKTVEISCLTMTESPTAFPCDLQSVLHLCRGNIDPANCQSLAEYFYNANAKVTRGSSSGDEFAWKIAFDGRGKDTTCYPRTIGVQMLADVSTPDPGGNSLALTIVAIIIVMLVVICIVMVGLTYIHQRSVIERSNEVAEHELTVDDGPQPRDTYLSSPEQQHNYPPHFSYRSGAPASMPMYSMPPQKQVRIYDGGPNPIDGTFSQDAFYGLNDPHVEPSILPVGELYNKSSPSMYSYAPSRSPSHTPSHTFSDGGAMAVACADCGSQIGHPNTAPRCPVSGAIHPAKLLT
ncbi:hypothetical protein DIPPA_23958 [Diplonema papillatum]|nr:hypothetical protein DIPPA_23958 [Diplonema papillatum]|eukprot:gene11263-17323_t